MNLRRKIFFLIDHIKNKDIVGRQLEEIKLVNTNDTEYDLFLNKKIQELLLYVKNNVPFYRNINCSDFGCLPIVNKFMMKDNPQNFHSDNGIIIGKERHTSGSTGVPFSIQQDVYKAARVQAELIYYREILNDELGTKFINLVSPSNVEKVNKLARIKNNVILFDVTKMTKPVLDGLYRLLKKDKSIKYMLGYSSALKAIADHFQDNGYKISTLKAVVSSSEIISDLTMKKLSDVLGCPVYDRYSNEDQGFIAQTDGLTHDFIINRASYIVEILKMDSNEKAQENEVGRIVITDLFNKAQPFVRYDTGDLGAYSFRVIGGARRQVLTKLSGRISDLVYDDKDQPVNTFAIGNALEIFDNIKQYQLVQNGPSLFELSVIDTTNAYSDSEYIKALQKVLGYNSDIKVVRKNVLPVLNSGKFRRVICNYHPQENNNN